MTEDQISQVAVFRFGVIGDFVSGAEMTRPERRRLLRDKCARKWQIPFSEKTRISQSTIKRWIQLYQDSNGDLKSLYPQDRSDQGKSRAMDENTCLSLTRLVNEMNRRKLVTPGIQLNPSTVYRFLHQQNMMSKIMHEPEDRRKFEAELPKDLWQSDVIHGPKVQVDGKMRKTYLIAIIDDHSRLIVNAQFYLSEALASYLSALERALLKRGLPRKLYVDNGPAFRSKHLEYITAALNIALVHARPYKPQGKIERWFKTISKLIKPLYILSSLNYLLLNSNRFEIHSVKHFITAWFNIIIISGIAKSSEIISNTSPF